MNLKINILEHAKCIWLEKTKKVSFPQDALRATKKGMCKVHKIRLSFSSVQTKVRTCTNSYLNSIWGLSYKKHFPPELAQCVNLRTPCHKETFFVLSPKAYFSHLNFFSIYKHNWVDIKLES